MNRLANYLGQVVLNLCKEGGDKDVIIAVGQGIQQLMQDRVVLENGKLADVGDKIELLQDLVYRTGPSLIPWVCPMLMEALTEKVALEEGSGNFVWTVVMKDLMSRVCPVFPWTLYFLGAN